MHIVVEHGSHTEDLPINSESVMSDDDFRHLLSAMRPRLHRYCARMTGSVIDGEDVVQEVMVKALVARQSMADPANPEGWLFRIAHNASLDHLRSRMRGETVPLTDDIRSGVEEAAPGVAIGSFRIFLELPVLQRCAVILKDVLGHSVEEVATIAGCSRPAAKSALQRGRARLKMLRTGARAFDRPADASQAQTQRLSGYVALFRAGDFDAIRSMLAEEVHLDLVNRLELDGKQAIGRYFTGYAEATHWRFANGQVEGRRAMLVFDAHGPMCEPAHFVLVEWTADDTIALIRDFLFAPYAMEELDWRRFDC